MKVRSLTRSLIILIISTGVFCMFFMQLLVLKCPAVPIIQFTLNQRQPSMELLKFLKDLNAQIIVKNNFVAATALKLKSNFNEGRDFQLNSNLGGMENVTLIQTIRKLLIPPSIKPYKHANFKLYRPGANPSSGQIQAVQDILLGFDTGFFVDCGANDGEWNSNTIWLEKTLGWEGLLIEPDPVSFHRLKAKHRKAWVGGFCISDVPFAKNATLYLQNKYVYHLGSGLIPSKRYSATKPFPVQCFPLYSILLAVNRTVVDFLSLDVEGSELDVLRTVPFHKVVFKIITIEHLVLKEGKLGLRNFMEDKGFIFYRTVVHANFSSGDSIFIHPSVPLTEKQRRRIGIEDSDITREPR